jgi:hypothetical protein
MTGEFKATATLNKQEYAIIAVQNIFRRHITKLTKHTRRNMASGPSSDVEEFGRVLKSSTRVLALCGAGLSEASGLDTFRGAGGIWRSHQATTLATPEAFTADPGLVWLFYSYRRYKALQAQPNAGHYALVELSKKMPGFITLTQNVDGKMLALNLASIPLSGRSCDTSHSSPFPTSVSIHD